ncbi:hypothetical protein ACIHCM_04505 [Streptomyces sp. NPDC052023]|uniref:hypothetical protein n=1 Tax=Streptomyces sp. NPDC052023 TaxID=3365681 RepID=UPI0037CF9624
MAQDVARNVQREKRKIRQSRAMPTLLIVDVPGTDLPDLRCWQQAFDRICMTSRIHGPCTLTDEDVSECGKPRNDNAAMA